MSDTIKRVELKSGKVRYRFVVDAGADPATGKRRQLTRTFDTLREARAERARIIAETARGTFVQPRKLTVSEYLTEWLEGATRNVRESTRRNYSDALTPVHNRLGARKLQDLTKADIEALVTWMATSGRKRGGKAGTGLGPRSIRLTLGRLAAALDMAQAEGLVVRNVAKLVTPPSYVAAERDTWSTAEVATFKTAAAEHRLNAAWLLTMYGMRRGEVLGLQWSDIDLAAGSLTIRQARVLVDGKVRIEAPKSRRGFRTLPLSEDLFAALRALKASQSRERLAAGEAYEASGYVVADELGAPVHPEWYSDEFGRVREGAGLPRIVLHGARHTSCSIMAAAGVPLPHIQQWHGHANLKSAEPYLHADRSEDMAQVLAMSPIHVLRREV